MAKRIAQPAPVEDAAPVQTSAITVGLDIGYGATKLVTPGLSPILFPSVWGLASFPSKKDRTQILGGNESNPSELLTIDGQDWLIGGFAQRQLNAGQLLSLRGRSGSGDVYGNDARLKLFKAAIGKVGALLKLTQGEVLHISLATGLPVSHMDGAEALEATLKGQHHIETAAADFVANVADLYVMPQPYGSIYANQFTEGGQYNPCHTATRTAVVDVGTYTVDLALDDDGEYISGESDSVEGGVYLVHQRLTSLLKAEGYDMDKAKSGELDKILRTKCIQVGAKVDRVESAVEGAIDVIRENTVNRMKQLWRTGRTIDVIYLSGGGAGLIKDAVREAGFEQAVQVEDSQFANARGYLNFALFDARNP